MERHCWKDYREHLEETGRFASTEWIQTYEDTDEGGNRTCLLPDGHEGAHEWTRDSMFSVEFPA